jgi:hypothetical protein
VAESLSSVLTIIVVMFALVGFTASFQQAVDELVVMPLERMMDTLKSSASSILRSVQAIAHEKMPDGDDDLTENIDGEVRSNKAKAAVWTPFSCCALFLWLPPPSPAAPPPSADS